MKEKLFLWLAPVLREKRRREPPPDPRTWGLDVNAGGHLAVHGHDLVELANTYGSPLFVVNEGQLRANCRRVVSDFQTHMPGCQVFFSYKTNPLPGMLLLFRDEGLGAEVVSEYELWLALRLGVPPGKIIYNGPNKTRESLAMAVQRDIKLVNLDSLSEIVKIGEEAARLGKQVRVGIRVTTGVGWGQQFGMSVADGVALDAVQRISRMPELDFQAVHFHLGTGLTSAEPYCRALEQVFRLLADIKRATGVEVGQLDIGGGFGVPTVRTPTHRETQLQELRDVPVASPPGAGGLLAYEFAAPLKASLAALTARYGLRMPSIIVEPGSLLSSSSQVLLLTIGDLKTRVGRSTVAIADGGVNIAVPLRYGYHECLVANRMNEPRQKIYRVTGKLCHPGDVLYRAKYFPELRSGDILAVMDAGAYFISNATNFCLPRPAAIVVGPAGVRVTRRREGFEDMVAYDDIPCGVSASVGNV